MEEIFDKLKYHAYKAKDEADKLTKIVVNKTNNMIGQTKLTFAANDTEAKMQQLYTEIGQMVYQIHRDGDTTPEQVLEQCRQLDLLADELMTLKTKIAGMKDQIVCPSCGSYNSREGNFCQTCGAKLTHEEEDRDFSTAQQKQEQSIPLSPKRVTVKIKKETPQDDGAE